MHTHPLALVATSLVHLVDRPEDDIAELRADIIQHCFLVSQDFADVVVLVVRAEIRRHSVPPPAPRTTCQPSPGGGHGPCAGSSSVETRSIRSQAASAVAGCGACALISVGGGACMEPAGGVEAIGSRGLRVIIAVALGDLFFDEVVDFGL